MAKHLNTITRFEWRGGSHENITDGEATDTEKQRVVLLVGGANRELLAKELRRNYELVPVRESHLNPGSFDMAIADIDGLRTWQAQLMDEKLREEPTFLPVVLVLSSRELRYRFKTFWDVIDEFIIAPINPHEFNERISLLLRTRRLALTQRAHLAYLVNHDRTTGLPNQGLFLEHMADAIRDASILGKSVHSAVIHISLARVMHSLGHAGLERAAAQCSSRLVTLLNNEAYIARLTTEDWGLIFRPGEELARTLNLVGKIRQIADEPIETNGERVHLSPRIGIGAYPDDGNDAITILNCATAALSSANDSTPVFYSRRVQHEALRFIRTQARLHEALIKRQLELWYQPQVDIAREELVGVEALIRWRLPNGELVPPSEFVPVAEATGQVVAIDRWALETACATMHTWQQSGIAIRRVSVNVTATDIESPNFVSLVQSSLLKHNLPPPTLELELTETALLETRAENLEKLNQLRAYGIHIAIDDFGTGYSSLGYLHTLPITTLKIDKTFVDNVVNSSTDAAITETIVWLARKFNLETIAEGVETREQAEFLRVLGVTTAQGYFYGRPMPDQQLKEWLIRTKTRTGR